MNGGGFWGIFNAILGWENSATYGSVISYNLYWIAVIIVFWSMRYFEKHGHWPLMKPKAKHMSSPSDLESSSDEPSSSAGPSGGVLMTAMDKKPAAEVVAVRSESISE